MPPKKKNAIRKKRGSKIKLIPAQNFFLITTPIGDGVMSEDGKFLKTEDGKFIIKE